MSEKPGDWTELRSATKYGEIHQNDLLQTAKNEYLSKSRFAVIKKTQSSNFCQLAFKEFRIRALICK